LPALQFKGMFKFFCKRHLLKLLPILLIRKASEACYSHRQMDRDVLPIAAEGLVL
jgi:hypothetical protein